MDFIERIFGMSPDDGSGTFEFLLFAVPIALLAMRAVWQRRTAQQRRRRDEA